MGKLKELMIEFEEFLALEQRKREEYEQKRFKRDDFYDKTREYWRSISGHDNFEISTHGRVRNIHTMKISIGTLFNSGYRVIRIDNKRYCIHRLVAQEWINDEKKQCVDHIDGNKQNNHLSNLRWATTKENCRNTKKRKDNTSQYKGVTFHKRDKKYQAQLKSNGKSFHLGYFDLPEEAHKAYCGKAKELFGEFARFN